MTIAHGPLGSVYRRLDTTQSKNQERTAAAAAVTTTAKTTSRRQEQREPLIQSCHHSASAKAAPQRPVRFRALRCAGSRSSDTISGGQQINPNRRAYRSAATEFSPADDTQVRRGLRGDASSGRADRCSLPIHQGGAPALVAAGAQPPPRRWLVPVLSRWFS
jgi:hypothetical protein